MDDVLMSAPLFAALDIEAAAALKASMDERRMLKGDVLFSEGDPGDRLYVVTDEKVSRGRSHLEVAGKAILGGADVIQYRDKTSPSGEMYRIALAMRKLTRDAGVPLIINDRLDIALAVGATRDGAELAAPVEAALASLQAAGVAPQASAPSGAGCVAMTDDGYTLSLIHISEPTRPY